MIENIPKIVSETLGVLAEKFGATGAHLWEVVVRQQYVEAVMGIIYTIGSVLIVCFILIPWAHKIIEEKWDGVAWIPFFLVSVIISLVIFCSIYSMVTGFVNPEYGALKSVTSMFRSNDSE